MNIRQETALTFDDVLLVPKRSSIGSRTEVSTSSWLTSGIQVEIPIISANMDTVTETHMGIAMAQQGGIGILHRFMGIEQQAEMVRKIKRAENLVVDQPLTISPASSIEQARQRMIDADVGGLMVVDAENHLLGVITTRDVLLARDGNILVSQVMTGRERLIVASPQESMEAARQKLYDSRVEKLPLVDEHGRLIGLITAQDIVKLQEHPKATKDVRGRLRVGVAIGVRADDIDRAGACVDAGADLLVIDIAHGHSDHTLSMIRILKKQFPKIPVIAGNVASAVGVADLADAGADAVKVGVGAGSICITRVVTGFGVPQLSAIDDCAQMAHQLKIPIIADGGLRNSGDVVKALAAGASTVMLGSVLAGTEESPGAEVIRDGRQYKVVRGMASLSANVERRFVDKGRVEEEEWGEIVAEGVEAVVPFRGELADVLNQIVGGLRSGMSYAGARTIEELWENAEFVRVTAAGRAESGTHDVVKI